jgi:hypothetical protein
VKRNTSQKKKKIKQKGKHSARILPACGPQKGETSSLRQTENKHSSVRPIYAKKKMIETTLRSKEREATKSKINQCLECVSS